MAVFHALSLRVCRMAGKRCAPIAISPIYLLLHKILTTFSIFVNGAPENKKMARLYSRAIKEKVSSSSDRSEANTSELQSLMRNSYAVFCLKTTRKHKYELHSIIHST